MGLIAWAAALFPRRDAFVFLPSGELDAPPERVSYAQLLGRIHRAANLFRSLGVGADDAVATLAPDIPPTHYALCGAQLAGRACPINDRLQPDHIAALLNASGARVIVALGPNRELDIWSTLRKVIALHPLPVIAFGGDGGLPHDAIDFATGLQDQANELPFPSLPTTTIGTVCQPALRLLAIETQLAAMLAPHRAPVRCDAMAAISAPIEIRFAG